MRNQKEIQEISIYFHAKMEEYQNTSNPYRKDMISLEMGRIILPLRGTRFSFYQRSFERWYDMHQPSSIVHGAPVPTLESLKSIDATLQDLASATENEFEWATAQFGL